MKSRIRIAQAIIAISLILIAIAIGFEAYSAVSAYRATRAILQESELEITRTSGNALHQDIRAGGLPAAALRLAEIQTNTHAELAALLSPGGELIAVQPAGRPPAPLDAAGRQTLTEQAILARWLPDHTTLQVTVLLPAAVDSPAYLFIRQVNLDPVISALRTAIYRRIALALVIITALTLVYIWLVWHTTLRPLRGIVAVARQATEGDFSPRVERQPVTELDNIGQGINLLLSRVQAQTFQLEELNRGLEETIQRRTAELQQANQDLQRQTDRLNAQANNLQIINRILETAAGAANLEQLADAVLSEIIAAFHADYGRLRIFTVETSFPPSSGIDQAADSPSALLQRLVDHGNHVGLAVPVLAQGKVIGRILLGNRQNDRWEENEESLLNLIGQQLGAAAENIQAYATSRETNRMMARLIHFSDRLNQELDLDEMYAMIGSSALDLSGAERGAFLNLDRNNTLSVTWNRGVSRRFIQELSSKGLESGAFSLPGDSNLVYIPDLELLPDPQREWWRANGEGLRSLILLPILYEGQLSACLVSFYMEPGAAEILYPEILEAFASQAATALENARLIKAERQQRRLAEVLLDISTIFSSSLDPDVIFERILLNLEQVVHHDAASIMLIEDDELRVIRAVGYPTPTGQPAQRNYPLKVFPEVVYMRESGMAAIVPDTHHDPFWVFTPSTRWIQSYAGAPIFSHGSLVGVINLMGKEAGLFSPEQVPILQAFAVQAALAIENARRYQATLRDLDETGTLYRALTELLTAGGEAQEVARKIVLSLTSLLKVGHCSLSLIDSAGRRTRLLHAAGSFSAVVPEIQLEGPGLTPAAIRQRVPIYIPDVQLEPRYLPGSPETRSEYIIPFFSTADELFAVLNIEDGRVDAFDQETRAVLLNFSSHAALVLENALLFETAREQARRTRLLNQIAQAALEADDIAGSLAEIARLVAELANADLTAIGLGSEVRPDVLQGAVWRADAPAPSEIRAEEEAALQMVIAASQPVVTPVPTEAGAGEDSEDREYLGIPLVAGGMSIGAILVGRRLPAGFTPEWVDLLSQAGVGITLGITKIRLLETTRRRFEESEKLRQATAALTTQLDFNTILKLIAEHLPRLLRYDTLTVLLYRGNDVKPVLAENLPLKEELNSAFFKASNAICQEIIEKRAPVVLDDAQVDPRFQNWGGAEIHSWAAVPVFSGENVFGAVEIGRFTIEPFTPAELFLLQVYVQQAGAALQNATLHGIEQQHAMTDPLTGLYNRRGFLEQARHELERCWRFHRPFSLLMVDIDHFKTVNDTYGHPAGDAVLTQLAETMRSTLREVDIICRFGGEEFCVILPESSPQGALLAAERLRFAVEHAAYHFRITQINITVSIGLTSLLSYEQGLEELIETADRALLDSKKNGRNRVTVA